MIIVPCWLFLSLQVLQEGCAVHKITYHCVFTVVAYHWLHNFHFKS